MIFVIVFPILVAFGFFIVLIKKPYVFYPPSEYSNPTKPSEFINALRGDTQVHEEKSEANPLDKTSSDKHLIIAEDVKKPIKKDDWIAASNDGNYSDAREILLRLSKSKIRNEKIIYSHLAAHYLSLYDQKASIIELNQLISKYPDEFLFYNTLIDILLRKSNLI